MAYKSLAKLYYSDPQNYTQIYKNRFVSTESVHINFSVAKNPTQIASVSWTPAR